MKLLPSQRRQAPFYWALACAAIAALTSFWLSPQLAVELSANTFFLVFLLLTAIRIPRLTADHMRENASGDDEPVAIIFIVAVATVAVAVGSLFLLLNESDSPRPLELALSLASVALGWMTLHTMASLHYAHLYWGPDETSGKPRKPTGGLDFPGEQEPNGYDFLYFGFVLGMTAQTSDTEITSTGMRKAALLHSIVSFLFNTVLVAAAVNVAVSLGSGK